MKLDKKSLIKLQGVHPDLVAVANLAAELSPIDFFITEGLRTVERQAALVKAGASRTMKSRHITGHAFDVAVRVNGEVRWDWPLYIKLAKYIKLAATKLKVDIEWGGDWKTFKDAPHWQLNKVKYP